jgi:lipoprotein
MNKLILIIAAMLCIILAACVGNAKVKNVDGNKVNSPVDTVALFDRINELNASIGGALATVCDTSALPIEYTELIFPEGKNPGIGSEFTAVLSQFMDEEFSLDKAAKTSAEKEVVETKEFKDVLNNVLKGASDYTSSEGGDVEDVIMEKYLQALEDTASNLNDIIFITNKYIQLVANSDELNEDSKDSMYLMFDIAVSASKYWMPKMQ